MILMTYVIKGDGKFYLQMVLEEPLFFKTNYHFCLTDKTSNWQHTTLLKMIINFAYNSFYKEHCFLNKYGNIACNETTVENILFSEKIEWY